MKKTFLLGLILFLFNVSCQAQIEESDVITEKIEKAVESSNEWLKIVDSTNYEMSWETASDLFKKRVTKENWNKALVGVRKPLGNMITREIKSKKYKTSLPGVPDGEFVMIVYSTEFENKENSYETVTPMKDNDGKWRVSGYFIK